MAEPRHQAPPGHHPAHLQRLLLPLRPGGVLLRRRSARPPGRRGGHGVRNTLRWGAPRPRTKTLLPPPAVPENTDSPPTPREEQECDRGWAGGGGFGLCPTGARLTSIWACVGGDPGVACLGWKLPRATKTLVGDFPAMATAKKLFRLFGLTHE